MARKLCHLCHGPALSVQRSAGLGEGGEGNAFTREAYRGRAPASPRATSVMDYSVDEDAVYLYTPGPYDVEAVRYLYGLSTQLPTLAFCTDDETAVDPYCNPSDRFDDPLTKYYIPRFHERVDVWLRGTRPISQLLRSFDFYVKFPLQFVRAGNAQTRASAYLLILAPVRPPLQVPDGAPATYAAQADEIAWRTLARLYLDPAASRGSFTANPPNSPDRRRGPGAGLAGGHLEASRLVLTSRRRRRRRARA